MLVVDARLLFFLLLAVVFIMATVISREVVSTCTSFEAESAACQM